MTPNSENGFCVAPAGNHAPLMVKMRSHGILRAKERDFLAAGQAFPSFLLCFSSAVQQICRNNLSYEDVRAYQAIRWLAKHKNDGPLVSRMIHVTQKGLICVKEPFVVTRFCIDHVSTDIVASNIIRAH